MIRPPLLPVALAVAVAAGGCSSPAAPPQLAPTPAALTAAPTPEAGEDDGVGVAPSAPAQPAAVAVAVAFVTAWARPDLPRDLWYAGVRRLAVPQYARLLADTDPVGVPAHAVVGPARVVSSTTAVVVADVPTDAVLVQVTVLQLGDRWLVATARPASS